MVQSVAKGLGIPLQDLRLGDIDGDGKVDSLVLNPLSGAIDYWHNDGAAYLSENGETVHFAGIDGDGLDDYIYLEPSTGAPIVFLNGGPLFLQKWKPVNGGHPIAKGAAPAHQVVLVDMDGDGKADENVIHPDSGAVFCWLNGGADSSSPHGWRWTAIGQIAKGLGPGASVRLVDLDNDGRADYVFLGEGGIMTAYKNVLQANQVHLGENFELWAHPSNPIARGVGAPVGQIQFADINGDGEADYLWLKPDESL